MAWTPCERRDTDHRAAYLKRSIHALGHNPAGAVSRTTGSAGRDRRIAGRSPVLRAVPAVLRPAARSTVDPDGDLSAHDDPAYPLQAGVRGVVPGGARQL